MKRLITCVILLTGVVFTSCATVFPVHNPDMNRDEYAGLIAAESERTVCYEKGFRGGMLFLDFVLGAPFLWTPLIFDAATGKYTAYYYHHNRCEKYKAEERRARLSQQHPPQVKYEGTNAPIESDPAFPTKNEQVEKSEPLPVETKVENVPPAPSAPVVENPEPTPVAEQPAEEDEYELLY